MSTSVLICTCKTMIDEWGIMQKVFEQVFDVVRSLFRLKMAVNSKLMTKHGKNLKYCSAKASNGRTGSF